jgi:hypothetical protein
MSGFTLVYLMGDVGPDFDTARIRQQHTHVKEGEGIHVLNKHAGGAGNHYVDRLYRAVAVA